MPVYKGRNYWRRLILGKERGGRGVIRQGATSPHNTGRDLPPELISESFTAGKSSPAEYIGPSQELHNAAVLVERGRRLTNSGTRRLSLTLSTPQDTTTTISNTGSWHVTLKPRYFTLPGAHCSLMPRPPRLSGGVELQE